MSTLRPNADLPCSTPGCCGGISSREALKAAAAGAVAAVSQRARAMAGPFVREDFAKLVPVDKKLSAEWVRSLLERGKPEVYRGDELKLIGMPIGGICTGQLYLGGDGRLWHWDIFNRHVGTGAEHYAKPMVPASPLEQGFAIRIAASGKSAVRTLDREGFADVSFRGEYPIGRVEYRDAQSPVSVSLEAFSPFVPLDAETSSLPATVLRFTVNNVGAEKVECELAGWLENAICLHSGPNWTGIRTNRIARREKLTVLECSAAGSAAGQERPPIVFADFEGPTYGDWKAEGEAFGKAPAKGAMGNDQRLSGQIGQGLVNTYLAADRFIGKLTSPQLTIERPYISFLIGGGDHPRETCINLIIDGKVVRTQTGKNTDAMAWANWSVADLAGKKAHLEIIDSHTGGWGHIDIDRIEFRDRPRGSAEKLDLENDFGTMTLALLDGDETDLGTPLVPAGAVAQAIFPLPPGETEASVPLAKKIIGALRRKMVLEPRASAVATFVLTWHFPNHKLGPVQGSAGRHYAARFPSAPAVAEHLAKNIDALAAQTRLWRDTWYDSTLPYWFLDRTFINTSILASSTCHWFADGRFYGWEGVGCCPGTCTHVWHYAHAVARLFPQLERDLRERTDFGLAFDAATGIIRFRGEGAGLAVDGQAGCVLRSYREHTMSADDAFLKRNWPKIKRALQCLIDKDPDGDGILDGPQHNTLDTDWHGPVAWLSGLYLAALRAGEAMAQEMNDTPFATTCRAILDRGPAKLVESLFDGEYFFNKPDPKRLDAINSGSGCEIDQVMGQSWAWQVNLGRVLPKAETLSALRSLWKYNFTPDVGPYREAHKPGRWYAMPGEAGLLMCSFPRADWDYRKAAGKGPEWAAGYFNECMNGFEYQAAGHMIWEGLVQEGLAITRAIHDRYHPSRRNPYNEVECGDHYARSMASYGVFLAACGFEYHGPTGHIGFAPRLTPDNFRAAFTAAEGWGTCWQKREGAKQVNGIELKSGQLRLATIALATEGRTKPSVTIDGRAVQAASAVQNDRLYVTLAAPVVLKAGQKLEVVMM